MAFSLSAYATSLAKKEFGALFLLSLLLLEGPKEIQEVLRVLRCSRRTLQRQLRVLGELVKVEEGVLYPQTNLTPPPTTNNNFFSLEQTARSQKKQTVRVKGNGASKATKLAGADSRARQGLYQRLAQRACPAIPGSSAEEVELVIARVDRWFVRPEHKPYLEQMVTAAAQSTAVADQAGTILTTGIQYFAGTLQNMARIGRWNPSLPVEKPRALVADNGPNEDTAQAASLSPTAVPSAPSPADPHLVLAQQVAAEVGLSRITPVQKRLVRKWREEWQLPADVILLAAERAAMGGISHFGYLDAVLANWHASGIATFAEAKDFLALRRKQPLRLCFGERPRREGVRPVRKQIDASEGLNRYIDP